MSKYLCDDGNAEVSIEADSAEEAAETYVSDGDWGDSTRTFWVNVWVQQEGADGEPVGDRERCTVTVPPEEPECGHPEGHDWQSPWSVVGGLKENPGVWGKGGGVVVTEVCRYCGRYCITDTWAQNPETGEQGLTSISYEDADEASRDYISGDRMSDELLQVQARCGACRGTGRTEEYSGALPCYACDGDQTIVVLLAPGSLDEALLRWARLAITFRSSVRQAGGSAQTAAEVIAASQAAGAAERVAMARWRVATAVTIATTEG